MGLGMGPKRFEDLTPGEHYLNNNYAFKWKVICELAGVDYHMSSAAEVIAAIKAQED